ncbi:hypothetical protein Vadar_010349 [Vaccinium darrowii]|uniref:Uncharacterized protein n=1 Tax=Vaccinium darrowii TaxID=229202 RepID=A0ACB7YUE8_9ERIC|nr:hypothetical protein Vadar_010349 [Vaccinium darrowii]
MVVLRNCEESESDKAIEYSEELNGFYFPPSPTYFPPLPTTFPPSPSDFPLYSPPSPPRPSSSNSCVAYVWSRVRMFVQQIYDLPDLAFLVQWLDDIVDSEAKNTALEYVDENDSLNPAFRLNSEPLKKQNEDIIDQLVIDSVDVRQYLIQYRDGALDGSLLGLFSWMNESEISYGQLFTSTPEPVLQTKFSLRVWQGHRGQWVVELCYGWNWLNIGTLKTAEGAPFSSESVIRVRGGKDLFDYSFPKLFLNKNREEPTRASRTGIPPLQSPPTEQQENPNDHLGLGCSEATGNDEYEAVGNFFDRHVAVGIGSESTVESEMAEARLTNRNCLNFELSLGTL